MKVVVILAALLSLLFLVSGQNCADDCRIVTNMEKRVKFIEDLVYRQISRQIAVGKN